MKNNQLKRSVKKEVEKLSESTGMTKIEAVTKLQELCVILKNEETLELLCDIKMDYINKIVD